MLIIKPGYPSWKENRYGLYQLSCIQSGAKPLPYVVACTYKWGGNHKLASVTMISLDFIILCGGFWRIINGVTTGIITQSLWSSSVVGEGIAWGFLWVRTTPIIPYIPPPLTQGCILPCSSSFRWASSPPPCDKLVGEASTLVMNKWPIHYIKLTSPSFGS